MNEPTCTTDEYGTKSWYLNGKYVTEEEFNEQTNFKSEVKMIDIGSKVRVVHPEYKIGIRNRQLDVGTIDTRVFIDLGGQIGTFIERLVCEPYGSDIWYKVQFKQGLFVIEECFRLNDIELISESATYSYRRRGTSSTFVSK